MKNERNPYEFKELGVVRYSKLSCNIETYIVATVEQLYPIHYDLLCRELAWCFGNEKVTERVRRGVDYGLARVKKQIIRKGNFLFPKSYEKITPRLHNDRKIDYVAKEELAEVMLAVLDKCFGVTKEALCVEAARAYNYDRMTQNISSAMDKAFELLLQENRVQIVEGKVVRTCVG